MVTKKKRQVKRKNKHRSYKKGGKGPVTKVYRINIKGESVKKGMPGADYLRDSNNIVYNANTGEQIGIWNGTQIVFDTYNNNDLESEKSLSSLNSTPDSESIETLPSSNSTSDSESKLSESTLSFLSDNDDKEYTELLKKYNAIKPIYEKMANFIKNYNMFNQSYKINNDEIINIV